jgi:uncharacterized protein with GYD domain
LTHDGARRILVATYRKEEHTMALYMLQVAYTPEAWATLVKKPQDRLEAVTPAIRKLGGKLIEGYFAFGEYDLVAIVQMPDNVTAAAFSISAAAGGAVKSIKTTPLMSRAEGLRAMRTAKKSTYTPPS